MITRQVTEPALDPVADDGVADRPTHDEPDPSRIGPVVPQDVDDEEVATAATARADHPPDVTTVGEPMRRGEHGRGSRAGGRAAGGSDRQALAALAPTRGQDAAPGTGAHAQPESVHLVAAAVVRLVRTLGHELSPMVVRGGHAGGGQIARLATDSAGRNSVTGSGLRPAPPTHAPLERPRSEPGRSVDMRHPSTPGDRGTVRAASSRRQIVAERPDHERGGRGRLWIPPVSGVPDHGFRRVPAACG